MTRWLPMAACFLLCSASVSVAGIKTKAAREAAEYVLKKFGKEAEQQGLETLTTKIETLAVKHGDDAITAVKKIGPRAFHFVEEAGDQAPQAIKLMARRGDAAIWVVAKKNRMAIFIKYGADAAEAMIKHGEIAEPLVNSLGKPAASALKAISTQNGRRLVMMANDGTLPRIGRTDELLDAIAKYGDMAMNFVWKNKGPLAVTTALAAFLSDPRPFLDGVKDITKIAAENVARPIASVPAQVATEAAKRTNWTLVLIALIVVGGVAVGCKMWLRNRMAKAPAQATEAHSREP
jgi:hypothetical protein